ncbi:MAG: lipopolysaccharide biosynthesis protein RfbH [Anaerolineae bacterium]|jgi:CDP-6-deoxy-D-xylo-4-hexulose-3-dehydrase
MPETSDAGVLRNQILKQVAEYYRMAHEDRTFVPGRTRVHYAGRVYDEQELIGAADAVLDFWLTTGPRTEAFEQGLAGYLGVSRALAVNSGSSANLLAVSALRSERLERPLVPGDEVITAAVGFPTTVAPLVQNRLVPVFVDCQLGSYNLDTEQLDRALSDRTRAIVLAHVLGNPVDMANVLEFAEEHGLYVIEDTCEALGSTYDGQLLGTFGDMATLSFYPSHHMTTGEGGAVVTSHVRLGRIACSLRDWGRDCRCVHDSPPEGACGHRFEWRIPGLDEPYDHRYIYVEIGYNMKMTDVQAAIGLAQLEKLPGFIAGRKENFRRLYEGLRPYQDHLLLPTWSRRADPAWFAFPLTVQPDIPFSRRDLVTFLEERNIETRLLLAGNLVRQPGYRGIKHRIVGHLPNADRVLRSSFFIGVYPGLDDARIAYILEAFSDFFDRL